MDGTSRFRNIPLNRNTFNAAVSKSRYTVTKCIDLRKARSFQY